jgi:large repetitive protein
VVDDAVTGTGSETIGSSGILQFKSSVSSGQTVTFAGAGMLSLLQPSSFSGAIAGFSGSDILDLAGFVAATTSVTDSAFNGTTTTLSVADTSGHSASFTMDGDYHAATFGEFNDGQGGSYIVLNPVAPPTVIPTAPAGNYQPGASAVFELKGVAVSRAANGFNINATDTSAADQIVAEIDALSSISVTGGFDGVRVTTMGASAVIFSAATNITASGSTTGTGNTGIGIFATAAGTNGNVTIDDLSNTLVSGSNIGIEAFANNSGAGDVAVHVFSDATIDASSSYGILALNRDAGSIAVTTSFGDVINAGGAGIDAVNQASSIAAAANSSVQVTALGTITSGTAATGSGSPPAGILAGYFGTSSNIAPTSYLPGVNGTVVVNNYANITADAGDGIRAYTYGVGDVTVNDYAGTITTLGEAITPAPPSGPNPPNGFGAGIGAYNYGPDDISVTAAAGTSIHSASSGISANNFDETAPSTSSILVVSYATIESGSIPTGSGSPAAGILAGYNFDNAVDSGTHGSVSIDDHGSITAAPGTDGIRGYNFGDGTVTITVESGASIDGPRFGVDAAGRDGGNLIVTNHGSVTGGTDAIDAITTGAGTATIDNYGHLIGAVAAYNATFTNYGDWSMNGTSVFTGDSTIANHGTIEFNNTGAIEVQSGNLLIADAMTGAGTGIIAGGTLELGAASDAQVQFSASQSASGTLVLDDVAHFTGTISGITMHGDTIDLVGISQANTALDYNSTTGVLELHYDSANPSVFIPITGGIVPTATSDSASYFSEHSDGNGGTDVVFDQGPVIDTDQFTLSQSGGTTTILGLSVSDADAASAAGILNLSAETAGAGSGTTITPSAESGALADIITTLADGVTYNPGSTPPPTDAVTLTVADNFGATDTVNFIFNQAGGSGPNVTLQGTAGKDVIFATGNNDTLTGGGGQDQFVFKPSSSPTAVDHTITDFVSGLDTLDLRQLNITAATLTSVLNSAQLVNSGHDTQITLDPNDATPNQFLVLKNVTTTLHASDFIVHG